MTDRQAKRVAIRRLAIAAAKRLDWILALHGYTRNKKLWKEPGDRRSS